MNKNISYYFDSYVNYNFHNKRKKIVSETILTEKIQFVFSMYLYIENTNGIFSVRIVSETIFFFFYYENCNCFCKKTV